MKAYRKITITYVAVVVSRFFFHSFEHWEMVFSWKLKKCPPAFFIKINISSVGWIAVHFSVLPIPSLLYLTLYKLLFHISCVAQFFFAFRLSYCLVWCSALVANQEDNLLKPWNQWSWTTMNITNASIE